MVDAICHNTWRVSFETKNIDLKTNNNDLHMQISFKHLGLNDEITFLNILELHPDIEGSLTNGLVSSIDLDLSRNFFTSLNLERIVPMILKKISAVLESPGLVFEKEESLKTICLSSNELIAFPSLSSSSSFLLEELYLNHNHISKIDAENQPNLSLISPYLRNVDLRNNCLKDVKGLCSLLEGHPVLEHLSLSSNQLTREQLIYFPSCPNLRLLGLFANQINVQDETESPINCLKSILEILVVKYPNLEDFYLLGNPLTAKLPYTVYVEIVGEYFPNLKYLDGKQIKCAT